MKRHSDRSGWHYRLVAERHRRNCRSSEATFVSAVLAADGAGINLRGVGRWVRKLKSLGVPQLKSLRLAWLSACLNFLANSRILRPNRVCHRRRKAITFLDLLRFWPFLIDNLCLQVLQAIIRIEAPFAIWSRFSPPEFPKRLVRRVVLFASCFRFAWIFLSSPPPDPQI